LGAGWIMTDRDYDIEEIKRQLDFLAPGRRPGPFARTRARRFRRHLVAQLLADWSGSPQALAVEALLGFPPDWRQQALEHGRRGDPSTGWEPKA
jgi:hypothetical protein